MVVASFALVRLSSHGVDDLRTTVRAHRAQGNELMPIGGDVSMRDLPRAYKLTHGGLFEDGHYLGEVTWYPSVRPAIAAVTSQLTGSSVIRSYYKSDLIIRLLTLISAFALMGVALERVGLMALAIAVCVGWPDLETASLYPGESSRFPFFCFFALLCWAWPRQSETDSSIVRYACLGGIAGLLGLWKGADFVISALTLAVAMARECWLHGISGWRLVARRLAVVAISFAAFIGLLLVPQLLHYGRIEEAESARLWLSGFYAGGTSPDEVLRLALFPREAQNWLFIPFAFALFDRRLGGRLWPLAIAALFCTVLAHLGYVVNDTAHPMLRAAARLLLRAPPGSIWLWILFRFIQLIGAAWAIAWLVAWGLGKADEGGQRRRNLALNAGLVMAATLVLVRPLPPTQLPGVPVSLTLARFARACSEALGRKTVVTENAELSALANLYLLWVPWPDHTNHYVQAERQSAQQALQNAIASKQYEQATAILNRYSVGGFVERGESTELSRSCGEDLLVTPDLHNGWALRAYRGRCVP